MVFVEGLGAQGDKGGVTAYNRSHDGELRHTRSHFEERKISSCARSSFKLILIAYAKANLFFE